MRSRASWRPLTLLVMVALGAGGCSSYLVEEGDPSAPILVQGRVVDASGGAMSGATVRLQVDADAGLGEGEAAPVVALGEFRAALDGTFTVRLAPTAEVQALADANGGSVAFTLIAFEGLSVPFAFTRELRDGAWTGDIPVVEFSPSGTTAHPLRLSWAARSPVG